MTQLSDLLARVEEAAHSMDCCHDEPAFDGMTCRFALEVAALLKALIASTASPAERQPQPRDTL